MLQKCIVGSKLPKALEQAIQVLTTPVPEIHSVLNRASVSRHLLVNACSRPLAACYPQYTFAGK